MTAHGVWGEPSDSDLERFRRDDERQPEDRHAPILNVDLHLDDSDAFNGLWAIPGSRHWSPETAAAEVARRNTAGTFVSDCAVVIPMDAGDVVLHDIGTLHGSPPSTGPLRRVVYAAR